jgi:hypothetical protein
VESYLYLRCILPESTDPDDYRALLPWNIDKSLLLDFDSGHLFWRIDPTYTAVFQETFGMKYSQQIKEARAYLESLPPEKFNVRE